MTSTPEHRTGDFFLDSSTLKTFLECPRKYYWSYVRHLTPQRIRTPLTFGAAIHNALEHHYRGNDPEESLRVFLDEFEDQEHDTIRTSARGAELLRKYFDKHPLHREPFTLLLPPEQRFEIQIGEYKYIGRLDLIIEWSGLNLVMDHKTSSRMGPYFFDQFRPDLQMTGYCFAASQLLDQTIHGSAINVLYMTKTKMEFHREIISREPFEYREFISLVTTLANEITTLRSRPREEYSLWLPNWTSCGRWGSCEFKDLCLAEDPEPLTEYLFDVRPWHPFDDTSQESHPRTEVPSRAEVPFRVKGAD